jgi:hypothetical protein
VRIYRSLIRGVGPTTYFRQYGNLTIQLFRECCQDAYHQRGTLGVLGLWFPSFRDAVTQMVIEVLCARQHTSHPYVSVGTVVSTLALEYFSAPIGIMRNFMWRLVLKRAEQRSWLKHPANMRFEQHLLHWKMVAPRTTHKSGVVTSGPQGRSSAFLQSTEASAQVMATLRQTIKADDYRGKQLRFSGEMKVEQVEQQAGLYIRTNVFHWKRIQEEFGDEQQVDLSLNTNRREERLRPQNMVQGTHDWMRYEVAVPVAEDALFIRFGVVLYGTGQIWLANARLEVIE